jgi:hypothetical protein
LFDSVSFDFVWIGSIPFWFSSVWFELVLFDLVVFDRPFGLCVGIGSKEEKDSDGLTCGPFDFVGHEEL